MTEYDIKRGNFGKVKLENLGEMLGEIFGGENVEVRDEKNNKYAVTYGAISPMVAWTKGKYILVVDITMDPEVEFDVGMDSRRKYNRFLDTATGFDSKKRRDRLKKKAKEGGK